MEGSLTLNFQSDWTWTFWRTRHCTKDDTRTQQAAAMMDALWTSASWGQRLLPYWRSLSSRAHSPCRLLLPSPRHWWALNPSFHALSLNFFNDAACPKWLWASGILRGWKDTWNHLFHSWEERNSGETSWIKSEVRLHQFKIISRYSFSSEWCLF